MPSKNNKKAKNTKKSQSGVKNNNTNAGPKQRNQMARGSTAQTVSVATGITNRVSQPKFLNRGSDMCVVHREFITDFSGTTGDIGVVVNQPINPGNYDLFPWLAGIARRFESYRFNKLVFEFNTMSSSIVSGYVAIVIDYDANDSAPTTKSQAFQYESTVKSAPWQNCYHYSTTENLNKRKSYFVQTSISPPTGAVDTYNVGTLFGLSGQNNATGAIGELWVSYSVNLMTPQLSTLGPVLGFGQKFIANNSLISNPLILQRPFGIASEILDQVAGGGLKSLSYESPTTVISRFRSILTFPQQYFLVMEFIGTVLTGLNITGSIPDVQIDTEITVTQGLGSTSIIAAYRVEIPPGEYFDVSLSGGVGFTLTRSTAFLLPYGVFES